MVVSLVECASEPIARSGEHTPPPQPCCRRTDHTVQRRTKTLEANWNRVLPSQLITPSRRGRFASHRHERPRPSLPPSQLPRLGPFAHMTKRRPMHTADWYRRKAEKCATRAKTARSNEERARYYALAAHYLRRATGELALSDAQHRAADRRPSSARRSYAQSPTVTRHIGQIRYSDAFNMGRNRPKIPFIFLIFCLRRNHRFDRDGSCATSLGPSRHCCFCRQVS
jgi:hypothetical protein